jgi:hypothetical protein
MMNEYVYGISGMIMNGETEVLGEKRIPVSLCPPPTTRTWLDLNLDHRSNRELNPLAPSDPYMGRTAQLTSRRCILNTYATNIHTEYFKCAA